MQQTCHQCGETLFGVVNRCWKCGTEVKVVVTPKIPPIRRGPVVLRPRQKAVAVATSDANSIGAVLDNAKQVLPWFLNMELTEQAKERCGAFGVGAGVLGCLIGIKSGWAILFGICGIAVGLLGMTAKKRDLATMALVVSVIAIFLGLAQIINGYWVEYATNKWIEEGLPLDQ